LQSAKHKSNEELEASEKRLEEAKQLLKIKEEELEAAKAEIDQLKINAKTTVDAEPKAEAEVKPEEPHQ